MTIAGMYTHDVSTQRLALVSGSKKEEYATNLASVPCAIHQSEGEDQQLGQGAFYQTFKMWCAVDTDIEIGDRVIDGDTTYNVKGVTLYDYGRNNHLMVLLVKGK